jgi:hypothetical protein
VLRFEVTGETRALLVDALAKVRRDAGEALDDDTALLLIARLVLGAADNSSAGHGRANYQVELSVCKNCSRAEQIGSGERQPVSSAAAQMSLCDAQVNDEHPEETHVGPRATRAISPALRRQVMRRDRGRCVVSGCKHATFVDVHHLVPRADGGKHTADNLVCLCGGHHRAVHEGRLFIQGLPSTGLMFSHSDGTRYGGALRVDVAERNAHVFAALRGLGFKERDCRGALARCTAALASDSSREEVLRAALGILGS